MPDQPLILVLSGQSLADEFLSAAPPGFRTRVVDTAQAAWNYALADPPALLALAVDLPGADGLSLIAPARMYCPNTPIIMLATPDNIERATSAFDLGVYAVLERPFKPWLVRARLEGALRLQQLSEERDVMVALLEQRNLELERAYQKLVALENQLVIGQLVQGLMHEINNPLSVIILNLALLEQMRIEDASINKRLEAIRQAAQRIDQTMKALETISFVLEEPRSAQIDLLVREEVEKVIRLGLLSEHQVDMSMPADLPLLQVQIHPLRLAVHQILVNAAEAVVSDPAARLHIRAYRDKNGLVLSIHNDGADIPPEELDRIFELSYTTKQSGGRLRGLGLGLFVARNAVEVNGGHLEVFSAPGQGVTFTISLPIKQGGSPETQ
jgi:signal transduction histidine kinase